MIKRNTVLIIGAGASAPYGLPLGSRLKTEIWQIADDGPDPNLTRVLQSLDIDKEEVRSVAKTFKQSRFESIDHFLSLPNHRKHVRFGKILIAYTIAKAESMQLLENAHADADWYQYLWSRMSKGVVSAHDLRTQPLTILTFNYDRSIEAYLFARIRATFAESDDEALAIVRDLKIIHMYGEVGKFDFADREGTRRYGTTGIDPRDITISVDGLRVIQDERLDMSTFQTGLHFIEEAISVAILGFGFDELNCQRLGIVPHFEALARARKLPGTYFYATTLGLSVKQAEEARKNLLGDYHWQAAPQLMMDAFRDWHIL